MRIGIYVCHCGTNIAATVNVESLRKFAEDLPNVKIARDYVYMCSDPGQELIKEDIRNEKLDRIVIAACSPKMHEPTFRKTLKEAGLNEYLLEMANIREQCSWIHRNKDDATRKAEELIASAVAKASLLEPLEALKVGVTHSALVIGGGIAGINAALAIAGEGFDVYLVEKKPSIGGRMAQLDKTFPTLDCAACILTPKMVDLSRHPKIELITYAEVEDVEGYIGNFKVRIRKKPRYVDEERCTGCGQCASVCPMMVLNDFDANLGVRRAIYLPFPQAVPLKYTRDLESCIGCGLCKIVCEPGAIDFDQKEEKIELEVGTIVVATGYDLFDVSERPEYGYKNENVITGLEFERLSSASGPTGGDIVVGIDREPKGVVFISCVGSREIGGNAYCSRICCMYIAKQAHIIKERLPNADVTVLYTDVMAFGKGYERFYNRMKDEGIEYRFKRKDNPIRVVRGREKLLIYVGEEDTPLVNRHIIEADLIVLATGVIPRKDAAHVARVLNISQKHNGFFLEAHPKLRPMDSFTDGIFLAGCCQSPRDIPDSVAQATGAASHACSILSKKEIEIEPIFCVVDYKKCIRCGMCIDFCPYGALILEEELKVIEVICKGCGACVANCPTGALEQIHFKDDQIISQIEGLFKWR